MIRKKNLKLKFMIVILLLIVPIIVGTFFITNDINHIKAETNNTNIDYYTNSDYLINDNTKTIFDYCLGDNPLYATNAKITAKDIPNGKLILEGTADDDIVQIVPKDLFCKADTTLHIGKEYGIFINTTNEADYYASTVLVFDININTDLQATNDTIILSVKQIFQYNYAYLFADRTRINYRQDSYNDYIDYSLQNDTVVAVPSKINYSILTNSITKIEYKPVEKYYLKDITMGIALFNENELNYGDNGYNVIDDNGLFVIGYDYDFKACMRDGNRIIPITNDKVDVVQATKNTLVWSLGWLKLIPKANTLSVIVTQLIELADVVKSWYPDVTTGVPVEYVVGEKPHFNEDGVGTFQLKSYYKSKATQLANYKDESGNPCLVKTAVIPFDASVEGGAWYGVNDFAMGRFEVSNSSQTMPINQTRLVSDIGLKIMDSETKELVMFGTSTQHKTIGDPVYKDIRVEQEQKLNLLPNGTNYFKFNAEYASDYTFNIPNANGIMVKVNGAVVNGSVSLNAGEHKVEIINLTEEKIFSSLTISPNAMYAPDNNKALTINANQTYLLKVTSLAGVKQLCTNNNNILIEALFNSELEPYTLKGTISPSALISHPFVEGTYYITIRNKLSSALEINFAITENISSIALGIERIITMSGDNYSYVKFTASEGGSYVITLENNDNVELCVYVLDDNLSAKPVKGGSFYTVQFNPSYTYFIGIKNGTHSDNSIFINMEKFAYEWIISDGDKVVSTFESYYEVDVRKTYTFSFRINNKLISDVHFRDSDIHGYEGVYKKNLSGNKLVLKEGCGLDIPGFYIDAESTDINDSSNTYASLQIIPKLNNPVILTSLFGNDTYNFNLKAAKGITKIDYTYYHNNSSIIASKSVNFSVDYNVDNNFDYVNSVTIDALKEVGESSAYNVTIKVNKYHYEVRGGNPHTFEKEIVGPSFSNLFAGGNGTEGNPYTISNYRHFKNMASLDCYFYLLNDINLGGDWIMPHTFMGKLNGNNKTVSYRLATNASSTVVRQSSTIGLFQINRGFIHSLNCNVLININDSTENQFVPSYFVNVGGICGVNFGIIQNCETSGYITVMLDQSQVGGLVGRNEGTIYHCRNRSYLMGNGDLGGISGSNFAPGYINDCHNYTQCAYHYDVNSRSVGGIVGYMYSGTVVNCVNNGAYVYCSPSSESRTLEPHMGQIVGQIDGGETSGNVCNGTLNIGTLHTVTWKPNWFETKSHNQAKYTSTGEFGLDNR